MTILQVLNSLFYLLIYPFLIRKLGAESYGLYIFAMSIVTYFIFFVSYGFDLLAVKSIAENIGNKVEKERTLSAVFTAKIYLEIISLFAFSLLVIMIPSFRENWVIFFICFLQTFSGIIFPQWYYQGVQKMRTVTGIQLLFKVLSLPFIFLLINTSSNLWIFVLITSLVSLMGAFTASLMIRYYEKLRIRILKFEDVMLWYRSGMPFFLSTVATVLKEQSVVVLIGIFFSMKDVAIYDLANKIISVPRILLFSLNGAIFPKMINNKKSKYVKKIIIFETVLGFIVILTVCLAGAFFVELLGGDKMSLSYSASILLSFTILNWLIVGSYINFIFIPLNKNYYVTYNQIVALTSFLVYSVFGLLLYNSIFALIIALSLSGITEIFYCTYIVYKKKFYGDIEK